MIMAFALTLPYFTYLMGLTGNITGLILAFLLPCMFHIKLKWHVISYKKRFLDVMIILLSLIASVVGTWNSLSTLKNKIMESHNTTSSSGSNF